MPVSDPLTAAESSGRSARTAPARSSQAPASATGNGSGSGFAAHVDQALTATESPAASTAPASTGPAAASTANAPAATPTSDPDGAEQPAGEPAQTLLAGKRTGAPVSAGKPLTTSKDDAAPPEDHAGTGAPNPVPVAAALPAPAVDPAVPKGGAQPAPEAAASDENGAATVTSEAGSRAPARQTSSRGSEGKEASARAAAGPEAERALAGAGAEPAAAAALSDTPPAPPLSAPAQTAPPPAAAPAQAPSLQHPAPPPTATPTAQVAAAMTAPVQITLAAPTQPGAPQTLTIQLKPVELGRVEVRIERSAEGTTKIALTVERTDTLMMLIRDQSQLHQALDGAGVPQEGRTLQFSLDQPTGSGTSGLAADAGPGGGGQRSGYGGGGHGGGHRGTQDADPAIAYSPWARSGLDITA